MVKHLEKEFGVLLVVKNTRAVDFCQCRGFFAGFHNSGKYSSGQGVTGREASVLVKPTGYFLTGRVVVFWLLLPALDRW